MEKIISNYHTHTYRCGHALGSDESYVKVAIEYGIKNLGFSDHISFKGLSFPKMRQDRDMLDDYLNSINNLKEKYKDVIDIKIGFEAEYIEEFLDDYRDLLNSHKIDYLICGQHCVIKNNEQVWYNRNYHDEKTIISYTDMVIKAMKSGLFKYIAHPDLFMNGYQIWDDAAIRESKRIIEASIEYNVPLEINVSGLRFHKGKNKRNKEGRLIENMYPYDDFWALVGEYNALGIIGVDAHRAEDFLDGVIEEAINIAKKYNISLVEKLDF